MKHKPSHSEVHRFMRPSNSVGIGRESATTRFPGRGLSSEGALARDPSTAIQLPATTRSKRGLSKREWRDSVFRRSRWRVPV